MIKNTKSSHKQVLIFWVLCTTAILTRNLFLAGENVNCPNPDRYLSPTAAWEIQSASLDAKLAWQGVDLDSRDDALFINSLTGITTSKSQVLYEQSGARRNCDTEPVIVAINEQTGEENWRYHFSHYPTDLFSVSDGYVLTNPWGVTFLSSTGEQRWIKDFNSINFSPRGVDKVYDNPDEICFAFVYDIRCMSKIDGAPGTSLSDIPGVIIGVVNDNKAVVGHYVSQLRLISLTDEYLDIYQLNLKSDINQDAVSFFYPRRVDLIDNVLFVYYTNERGELAIVAFDYTTGQELWRMIKPIVVYPGYPVPIKSYVAIYNIDNTIDFLDPKSGKVAGQIQLARIAAQESKTLSQDYPTIWLRADENTLFVYYFYDHELIAISLD